MWKVKSFKAKLLDAFKVYFAGLKEAKSEAFESVSRLIREVIGLYTMKIDEVEEYESMVRAHLKQVGRLK